MRQAKNKIEWLLRDDKVSNYRISKITGISEQLLSKYSQYGADIERISFGNAIKLYECFEMLERGKDFVPVISREEAFGRAFGALDYLSNLLFNHDYARSVDNIFSKDFRDEPMDILVKAQLYVAREAHRFTHVHLNIMQIVGDYINELGEIGYTNEEIEPGYVVYVAKERVRLREMMEKDEVK